MEEYFIHSSEVVVSVFTGFTSDKHEQVDILLCTYANSASYHSGKEMSKSLSKVNTDIAICHRYYYTAMGNHMLYGITQCYLPSAVVTFPPLLQPKLVLDLATLEDCKAELTLVVVTSQDSSPAKDSHLHLSQE